MFSDSAEHSAWNGQQVLRMSSIANTPTPSDAQRRRRSVLRVLFVTVATVLFALFLFTHTSMTPRSLGTTGGAARKRATEAGLNIIKQSASEYRLVNAAPPPSLETLQAGKYIEAGLLVDGWDTPFVYVLRTTGNTPTITLFSCGPDRTPGTPDDISVPWP